MVVRYQYDTSKVLGPMVVHQEGGGEEDYKRFESKRFKQSGKPVEDQLKVEQWTAALKVTL